LCYEKNLDNTRYFGSLLSGGDVPLLNSGNPIKELIFPVGSVRFNFVKNGKVDCGAYEKVELLDDIIVADGVNQNQFRMKAEFKWGQPMLNEEIANGTYFVIKTEKLSIRFQRPYDENNFKTPNNFLNLELNKEIGIGTNESAVKELENLLLSKFFDFPKPASLIKYLINMICKFDKEAIILDFFSGSATTAHAVMQLNAEDGGKRKFILVQWPEVTDEKSEAYKAGYKNICEIGKERIRRAGKKIQEEHPLSTQQLDVGFRVLKIDSSSINDVSKPVNEMSQEEMNFESERIKADRSSEDLLFQVLLQTQIPLSEKIERETICGNEVFMVGGVMVACLDKQATLTEAFFTALAERQPAMAFFRDDTFVDDSARTNLEQIFKQFSKDTKIKVL
jgi:adenine-specific DNA-methyltransferase